MGICSETTRLFIATRNKILISRYKNPLLHIIQIMRCEIFSIYRSRHSVIGKPTCYPTLSIFKVSGIKKRAVCMMIGRTLSGCLLDSVEAFSLYSQQCSYFSAKPPTAIGIPLHTGIQENLQVIYLCAATFPLWLSLALVSFLSKYS